MKPRLIYIFGDSSSHAKPKACVVFCMNVEAFSPVFCKWGFVDGQYAITIANNFAISVWGDAEWADYTVEVRARSINRVGCFGIDVRVQDPMSVYTWVLKAESNMLTWGLYNKGQKQYKRQRQ